MALFLLRPSPPHPNLFQSPNTNPDPRFSFISLPHPKPPSNRFPTVHSSCNGRDPVLPSKKSQSALIINLAAAAAIFLVGYRARACQIPLPQPSVIESSEDEEFRAAFERWKSKTFALTVPVRIVALGGSIPPSWIKDFIQVQGKRLKFSSDYRATLESIFSELSAASNKGVVQSKNAMAADLVTVGDSWLSSAIKDRLIEPIKNVEEQDWFKGLSNKWKE